MNQIKDDFKKSVDTNQYKVIRDSMLYCSNYITPSIIDKCLSLKLLYDSYHLYKITSFSCWSNSFIYAYLYYNFLFDHSFVTSSYKRNNIVKISKLKNDTINNLLYLYCKQISLYQLQNNVFNTIENYQYNIQYIIETIACVQEESTIDINQRINIMIHSNDNEIIVKHEDIIVNKLYNAYYKGIDKLGKHLVTQNTCLTDDLP